MTQEEKELLLKDLCARLLYGTIVSVTDGTIKYKAYIESISYKNIQVSPVSDSNFTAYTFYKISEIKPYLRPMSSMTEEEREELRQEQIKDEQLFADCIKNHPEMRGLIIPHFAADWCNKNHFDYHELIERGLAIKAPEGMYNIKEQ